MAEGMRPHSPTSAHSGAPCLGYDSNDWNKALCPDVETCAAKCALEGVDEKGYASNYGVTSTGSDLTLQFVVPGGNVGSRMYLMEDEHTYQMFNLKNKEFAFDVDVSKLGCGINGALYMVQMGTACGGTRTHAARFVL